MSGATTQLELTKQFPANSVAINVTWGYRHGSLQIHRHRRPRLPWLAAGGTPTPRCPGSSDSCPLRVRWSEPATTSLSWRQSRSSGHIRKGSQYLRLRRGSPRRVHGFVLTGKLYQFARRAVAVLCSIHANAPCRILHE